ncbi:SIALI-17 repeat-containing surface protein [Haemophilus haemolyticus]|uniref:SIALI-17 repeat-containing surface protein n=1 Tax=Haemophilus haemolyticus TaxID=726 RepID=UPI000E58F55F|nr:SIALI-17 repeat-containing surface protein [Haemophilus haemolyticus]
MLLNLNSKFKFFLTTTFLFSSPDTLALHLSVSIDDKESPISESLIIKDVISIGAVPFKVIRTELPPEFNGAVNGIPEVAAESPEFTGGVNDMDPPIHEIPEYTGCITNCSDVHRAEVSTPYKIYDKIDHGTVYADADKVKVSAEEKVSVEVYKVKVAVDKEADAPKILYEKGSPEIHSKSEFTGPVNGIPEEAEYPEFNGGVNGDKDGEADFQDRLPVVTYVSITAVPSNAPIMDKPEYVEPRQSLSKLKLEENNSILLKHQFNKLRSLQTYCIANKNEFCYGIRHHYMAKNDIHDNLLGLRLGYGITNKLTLGVNIERSLENHLPNNYRTLHNNVGIGAFVHYKLPSNSYIVAGIAKNNNSYLAPPYFNNSVTRYKGISWNLTLGQDLTLSNKNSLGWYLSYRNTQIKQNGYDAPASQFLMKYNNIKWTVHSLASGIKWNYSITTKLTWLNNIEIEHQIKSNVTGAVQIENLKHDYHLNIHKTQWSISSGLNYQFSPKFSVSLTPYIKNGLISSKQWGTYLSLEGKF